MIFNRPDPQCDVAYDKAFEAHYEGGWIDHLSGEDARDLLMRQWHHYLSNNPGPIIWKHQDMADVLTQFAESMCRLYAEEHRSDFLDEGEEF